jgi:predicted small secreted protein
MLKFKLLFAILVLLALAACNPSSGGLTSEESTEIGETLAVEAEDAASGITIDDLGNKVGGLSLEGSPLVLQAVSTQALPSCINNSNPGDTDSDGIPDNTTFTYNCTKTGAAGRSVTVTGQRKIVDPDTAIPNTVKGFDMDIIGLVHEFKNAAGNTVLKHTRNGTRQPRLSANLLQFKHQLTTLREKTGQAQATIVNNLNLAFTPASGLQINFGQPLPSGTVELTGNFSYTKGANARNVVVTTLSPLQHDSACASQRFVGGGLQAVVGGTGASGTITIAFQSCGNAPIITKVP